MSNKMKLIPELRFPEFEKGGEWTKSSIDELCDILNNIRKPITSTDRSPGEYPYYGASGVIDYIDEYLFDERLLLIGEDGAKWGAYDKTAFLVEGKYWVNNHAHVLKPVGIDDKLLESYLVKLNFNPYITGAAPPKLTLSKLKEILIPVPATLKEQQKIASCLSSLDELIAAHNDKLAALKDHKKGLLQNLFPQEGETVPKVRFPEFEGAGEWVEKAIQKICEVNPKVEDLPDEFIYVDLESVSNGLLLKKNLINKKGAPSRAQRLLKDKDVVYQMVRPYQKNNYYFIKSDSYEYVASTGYAQLRSFGSSMFLFQLIHTDMFVSAVLQKCTGSNYPAINSGSLKQIRVHIPPKIQEQQKIASCLSAVDDLIAAQELKIDQLQQHKKGLMQGLFPRID